MKKLVRVTHRESDYLRIGFRVSRSEYRELVNIDGVRYSKSLQSWLLPDSMACVALLEAIIKDKISIEEKGLASESVTNSNTTLIETDTGVSQQTRASTDEKDAGRIERSLSEFSIELVRKKLVVRMPYHKERVAYIKQLKGAWWHAEHRVWLVKPTLENVVRLQERFKYWSRDEYQKIEHLVCLIAAPSQLELYQTPELNGYFWIKLSGFGGDQEYLKNLPDRLYDKRFKRWRIPFCAEIVERIIAHYEKGGTRVINRLKIVNNDAGYQKKELSYGERKRYLVNKLSKEMQPIISSYVDTMIAQRYSWKTIKGYSGIIIRYANFLGVDHIRHADAAAANRFIISLATEKVAESSINRAVSALKYYYTKVIFRPDFELDRIKRPRKKLMLPTILSNKEVAKMLKSVSNLKHLTILYTLYGSGMRLGEIINLRCQDLNYDRRQIHIHAAKGKKDRVVMLSDVMLDLLHRYTDEYKPIYWLFEGANQEYRYSASSVQKIVKRAAEKAGIKRRVTPHTLRHCFATHMLDDGINIRYIQELLGHKSIKTTMVYTHITTATSEKITSPLDRLDLGEE